MDFYKCKVCGRIYDEEKEGKPISELDKDWQCPTCKNSKDELRKCDRDQFKFASLTQDEIKYNPEYARMNDTIENHMDIIHDMALTGKSVISPMKTKLPIVSWDDILIMGAQLDTLPLEKNEMVTTRAIIGKNSKKPLILDSPLYITHMSFGALSKEMKIAMARASARCRTATCSGEGGILPEERQAANKYIFEYVPNQYSATLESVADVDAIEIKVGQSTKPGMGGHLPAEKVTQEIAEIRGKPMGQDIISPSRFKDVSSKESLKDLIERLRIFSNGVPIGVKIAAGHIEKDLEFIAYAEPDFITIDGRGGSTGASPLLLKDATSVPTIYALYRARKYLDEHGLDIDLVITGGLRVASDFVKAIAMGADAVAIGTSILIAAGCQQYRICNSGRCPVGIATQDEQLRKRFEIDKSAKRITNFLNACYSEMKMFARITGHKNLQDLSVEDLRTVNPEIAKYTNIKHAALPSI